jgi:hypothetical protein
MQRVFGDTRGREVSRILLRAPQTAASLLFGADAADPMVNGASIVARRPRLCAGILTAKTSRHKQSASRTGTAGTPEVHSRAGRPRARPGPGDPGEAAISHIFEGAPPEAQEPSRAFR